MEIWEVQGMHSLLAIRGDADVKQKRPIDMAPDVQSEVEV